MNAKEKQTTQETLLKEYWKLIKTENMPKTPEITQKLDELESAIRALTTQKKKSENNPVIETGVPKRKRSKSRLSDGK